MTRSEERSEKLQYEADFDVDDRRYREDINTELNSPKCTCPVSMLCDEDICLACRLKY